MDMNLEGKKAIVTGAGKGIGREICKKLSKHGVEIYAISRTRTDLESLQTEIQNIHIYAVDLRDWDKTRDALNQIGPVDLLVNNAVVGTNCPFTETQKEDLDLIMDVNFKAVYNVSQVVAKGMTTKGNGGYIVNMSSIASKSAIVNGFSAYGASKAAVDMLTRFMALELGINKIRVNSVNPGVVWTDMTIPLADKLNNSPLMDLTPMGKFCNIEDVVNTVIFLLSDNSAMITGESIRIDGGVSVH